MALKLFNTRSRALEELQPRAAGRVAMYCCGPTVHNFAHIGNFRTFVSTDLLRRYLQFKGLDVTHVMNITDVEDKIIKAVQATGRKLREYTGEYEAAFLQDYDALNCLRPHHLPHATDFINEIIVLIEKLITRGVAYRASDGSVYFSIEKYRGCGCRYGQLTNLNFDQMRVGERVSADEYEKESVADFALWKAWVPEDGEVFWPSPWGDGRPGWHIECSAMSMKLLGPSFDLHLGGEDLIFPHHEDEIAQSEGAGVQAPGEPFVKYWVHCAHLLVEGKKMSKRLGNFFTFRDLIAKGYSGREIRCLLIQAHYREQFNFTIDGLNGARANLARIDEFVSKLRDLSAGASGDPNKAVLDAFATALDNDLNISGAWGIIFDWIRDTNRQIAENKFTAAQAAGALATWEKLDSVLGLGAKPAAEAPPELLALLEERQAARKAKNFARSDAIRDELKAKGWQIEDTPKGPRLKKI
jgi:cysteinyl-tRNA synthetase